LRGRVPRRAAGDAGRCAAAGTDPHAGRPARLQLVHPRELPRRGLGSDEGRAAFIHAIAHIELNAIDLGWDAVYRFRGLPAQFHADWVGVADDESRHFLLLRDRLREFGHDYGDFPAHNGLWEMCEKTAHDGLARMALVPRVLEARGLDVTPGMIVAARAGRRNRGDPGVILARKSGTSPRVRAGTAGTARSAASSRVGASANCWPNTPAATCMVRSTSKRGCWPASMPRSRGLQRASAEHAASRRPVSGRMAWPAHAPLPPAGDAGRRAPRSAGTLEGKAGGFPPAFRVHRVARWIVVMSTSLVSRRNSRPITRLIAAMMIGYHRPL
jgi:hypothetical protein